MARNNYQYEKRQKELAKKKKKDEKRLRKQGQADHRGDDNPEISDENAPGAENPDTAGKDGDD